MIQIFIGPLAILLSLSTGACILLHETKLDKLVVLAMDDPEIAANKVAKGALHSTPHTHTDHQTSFHAGSREFRTKSPGMAPRRDRDERYRLEKKVSRGFHLFDSYHLPLEGLTS